MSNNNKPWRVPLILVMLFCAGLYSGVVLLGKQWSEQARYLFSLLQLLLVILVCAGALLGVFKLIGYLWDLLVNRMAADTVATSTTATPEENSHSKQE